MTIKHGEPSLHQHAQFRLFLHEHGVDQIDGLELLRLVKMVANAYEGIMVALMGDEQLTGPRWRLLVRLLMEEQQGRSEVSPTHLSRTQHVSKNTISSHLRALEDRGLIERALDPDDRRQFRIRLSDRGRELLMASIPDHMHFLNDLVADLEPVEIDQLQMLLSKLHESLTERACLERSCSHSTLENKQQPASIGRRNSPCGETGRE